MKWLRIWWCKLRACEINSSSINSKQDAYPAARFDTLLLVLIAGATLTAARADAAWSPTPMAIRGICELLATGIVALFLRRHARSLPQARYLVTIAIFAAVAYPLATELVLRRFTEGSEPLEMLLLTGMELSAVVLAVFSHVPRLGGTAVLLSSFLLLCATTMSNDRQSLLLAGYGMLGLWWLMGAYWDRLAGAFVASNVERRIPVRISVIGSTGTALLLLATLISTTGVSAVALHGFMPTSGGTRWHDPHARSGVGDGDAMVAARDEAMSFGPVESELFLDSDMPTLYDMFNDLYGDPPKPKKKRERNVGLAPSDVKETEQQLAKTERSGREFSAVRRKVDRKPQSLDDRQAAAMLYVVGRVPLHLALERFDTFDRRVWTHSGEVEQRQAIRMEMRNQEPWAYLMRVGSSTLHRGIEPHGVKIINLKSNRFPSPPQLTAVHVDKVDQPDFFGWTADGVACMPVREHIPQLTVVHLRSQGVNLQPLRVASFRLAKNNQPKSDRPAESLRHRSQAGSSPHGWGHVEAVVKRLRTEFVLDRNAPAPEDCPDVVAHFLQARRGPAYLFATTAAMLVRELGYQTRLVTGFYARDDRFDQRAGQTSVLADDVHVWVEVCVSGNNWVAIEPTPGYDPPRESLTWRQWAIIAAARCADWFGRHIASVVIVLALAVLLMLTRRVWLDVLAVGVCRVMGLQSTRARLLWTIQLLEWRAWLTGRSRPMRSTLAAWYAPLVDDAPPHIKLPLAHFLHWTDRVLYSPAGIDAAEHAAVNFACRSVSTVCTRKRFATHFCQAK